MLSCQFYNVLFVSILTVIYAGFFWVLPWSCAPNRKDMWKGVLFLHVMVTAAVGFSVGIAFVANRTCF